jgi:hypothetical protein
LVLLRRTPTIRTARFQSDPDTPNISTWDVSAPPGAARFGHHCSVLRESQRCRPTGRFGACCSRPAHPCSSDDCLRTRCVMVARPLRSHLSLENCIASTSIRETKSCVIQRISQATKSQRWMPWRQMPMKDVGGCEKPWGAVYQALIHGYPNGETRLGSCPVTPT